MILCSGDVPRSGVSPAPFAGINRCPSLGARRYREQETRPLLAKGWELVLQER